jgi:hypothetical protein
MDTLKILQATDRANWDYDDEGTQEVVGLTVIGLRAKLAKAA